jgi:hypothetical protein
LWGRGGETRNTAILRKIKFISKENEWTKTSGKRETYNSEKEGARRVTKEQKMKRNNRKESTEINLQKLAFSSQRDNGMCIYDALGTLRQHCGHISSLSSKVLAFLKIVRPRPCYTDTRSYMLPLHDFAHTQATHKT